MQFRSLPICLEFRARRHAPCQRCLRSKRRRFSSGRSWPGSIDLRRVALLLMVLEDGHWLDPTSRELFDQIVDRLQRLPMLLVATFRPELSPPWIGFPHVTLLTLNRLPQAQVVALVNRITGGKSLPAEVLARSWRGPRGCRSSPRNSRRPCLNPGFCVRHRATVIVLAGPLPSLAIPATLHDSLMARLDRLAPVKEVAQIGACIGREFDHELLAAVVSMPEAELAAALDRLVAAELVFRRGLPPAATYMFKHALVRDAAYESLLKRRRQELHARIATSIEGAVSTACRSAAGTGRPSFQRGGTGGEGYSVLAAGRSPRSRPIGEYGGDSPFAIWARMRPSA